MSESVVNRGSVQETTHGLPHGTCHDEYPWLALRVSLAGAMVHSWKAGSLHKAEGRNSVL